MTKEQIQNLTDEKLEEEINIRKSTAERIMERKRELWNLSDEQSRRLKKEIKL